MSYKQRACKPVEERFWSKVDKSGECWEWTGALRGDGYGTFGLGRAVDGYTYAHRFSFELTRGPIPEGLVVCHHCDNRRCVKPDHLFLGTKKDNQQDMVAKGRSLRGERHNLAQLTEPQVLEIRSLWAAGGLAQAAIAERFGTNKANVSQIVRGKKWKHLLPADWQAPQPNRWSRA